jgi:UDP-glucuronate decarboxylase
LFLLTSLTLSRNNLKIEIYCLFLLQLVQETIDPDAKIEHRPNTEDDPHKRKPDITKAKELLGWQPKLELRNYRKGLPLMVSDFRKRIFGDQKEDVTTITM